jgi:peptidyl-prolyl cis-trans isomerase D
LIKLISERSSKAPTLEESKADIIEQLKRSEAESQFTTKLDKLKDLAYNADKLEEVAKELGLQARNTGLFSKSGGKDLAANNAFISAAFSPEVLEQGNASDVVELETNRVVVIKKTERKPAELQPLDAVRAQITETVRTEKTLALLTQQAKEFVDAVNAGKSIADQAKASGLEAKTVTAIGRTDRSIESDVLQYVFSLASPVEGKQIAGSVKTMKGDYAVVSLNGVHLGDLTKVPEDQRKAIATQLASINGEYDFKTYQAHLEEVGKIKRAK